LLTNLVQVHPWYVVADRDAYTPEEISSAQAIEEILHSCKSLAEEINQSAASEYEKARKVGYADGIEAAKNEALKKCIELAESAADYVRQFDKEIVSLVTQTIANALPMLPQESLLPILVEQALAEIKIGKFLLFKCHPDSLDTLQKIVMQLKESNPQLEHLKVTPDSSFKKFECLVETGFGSVHTNLESLLKIILRRLDSPARRLPSLDLEEAE
jgi:flagellar biosynthesis/type III secretory pathway protein FliH